MADNHTQSLIDHLDESLIGKGSVEMEKKISDDPEMAQEWIHLNLAVNAVQDAGLHEQVAAVKAVWLAQRPVEAQAGFVRARADLSGTDADAVIRPAATRVRTLYLNVMRVAACILILAGGAGVFKYATTSSSGLYGKYYTSYILNANRGNEAKDAMGEAYNNKNWEAVIMLFNTTKEKTNKSYFLTGMADLELKKYVDAIDKFQQVIAANVLSGSDYFQDEAEYYLAMSWLASNDANEAYPLFEKIKANKGHLYHDKVAEMSFTDLHIAQYKNHK
ncbi:MAG TPA: hypothetical protein VNS58_06540 [Puia sp.]|nr:hypothetical protein [Puia sp.]